MVHDHPSESAKDTLAKHSSWRRSKWQPLAVFCGGGFGLLLLLGITAIVFGVRSASRLFTDADQITRQFMQYVASGQDDKAYAMTASGWRQRSSLKEFRNFADFWRQHQGAMKTATLTGKWWYAGTDGVRITMTYDVQGSSGSGKIAVVVVPEGSTLRILSCNYNP